MTIFLGRFTRPLAALVAVVVAVAIMGALLPHFASPLNLSNILVQAALTAVAAYGMTLVLLTGGIDLSIGGVMSFVGVVEAGLITAGVPWPAAIVVGLIGSTFVGLLNGLGVAILGLPPFIATFGTLGIASGLALFIADSVDIASLPRVMTEIGNGKIQGFAYLVIIAVVVLVLLEFLIRRTSWGVRLRATGDAIDVARLSGVPVVRTLVSAYLVSGLAAGVAGTLLACNLSTAGPLQGEPYTLAAVAACVVGGVDLFGGRGQLWAAALGTVFLSAIRSALNLQGVQPFIQGLVTGILIIVAVFVTANAAAIRRVATRRIHLKRTVA